MSLSFKILSLFIILNLFHLVYAQNTTLGHDKEEDWKLSNEAKNKNGKILLIPFDERLYLSEIDKNIAQETKMNFDQIRNAFRFGIDANLLMQFKSNYYTVSLLSDTFMASRDIEYIYKSTGYKYEPVPEETEKKNSLQKSNTKSGSPNQREDKPKITNGQLTVEMSYGNKFMNAVVENPALLATLNKKYKADIFIFINELDIKNDFQNTYDISSDSYQRKVIVHYTVFDKSGKQLDCGIASAHFSNKLNHPKKIMNACFPSIAQIIYANLSKALSTGKNQKPKQ